MLSDLGYFIVLSPYLLGQQGRERYPSDEGHAKAGSDLVRLLGGRDIPGCARTQSGGSDRTPARCALAEEDLAPSRNTYLVRRPQRQRYRTLR